MNANIFVYRCRYGICLFMNSFCLCWPTDRPLTQEGQPVAWLKRQAQRELPCKFEVGNPRTKWRFRWERHLQIGNFLASHVWGHQRRRGLQLADSSLHLLHRVLAMRSRNRVWDLESCKNFWASPNQHGKAKKYQYIYNIKMVGKKCVWLFGEQTATTKGWSFGGSSWGRNHVQFVSVLLLGKLIQSNRERN